MDRQVSGMDQKPQCYSCSCRAYSGPRAYPTESPRITQKEAVRTAHTQDVFSPLSTDVSLSHCPRQKPAGHTRHQMTTRTGHGTKEQRWYQTETSWVSGKAKGMEGERSPHRAGLLVNSQEGPVFPNLLSEETPQVGRAQREPAALGGMGPLCQGAEHLRTSGPPKGRCSYQLGSQTSEGGG